MGAGQSSAKDMGKVKIKLDKPQYVVGEQVSGMILLDLFVDVEVDSKSELWGLG